MKLQKLPRECIALIKSHLNNKSFQQFNLTCSQVNDSEISRNEISARKCGFHQCSVRIVFEEQALNCGHLSCLKYLQSQVPDNELFLSYLRLHDNGFLKTASYTNKIEILKYLLEIGLGVNDVRACNNWALRFASEKGNTEVVKLLLSTGLTIEDIRCMDNYALRWTVTYGRLETVKLLLSSGLTSEDSRALRNWPLREAAKYGHLEIVKLLLSTGLTLEDINIGNSDALCCAAENYHLEIVKLLLASISELGGDGAVREAIQASNNWNRATRRSREEVIQYLEDVYNTLA